MEPDHDLDFLLSVDGFEFRLASGYAVKIDARLAEATAGRPHGVKYSLTLHGPAGERIYGIDNAHGVRRLMAYDHRHTYGRRKVVAYQYQGPAVLLADFYREAERILEERGVL